MYTEYPGDGDSTQISSVTKDVQYEPKVTSTKLGCICYKQKIIGIDKEDKTNTR